MYGRWATYRATLQNYLQRLDWPLLIFLTLFLNVKLYVKVTAVLFALIMRKPLVPKASFPPWWRFYAAMIVLALINLVLSFSTLSLPALYAFGLGCISFCTTRRQGEDLYDHYFFLSAQRRDHDLVVYRDLYRSRCAQSL